MKIKVQSLLWCIVCLFCFVAKGGEVTIENPYADLDWNQIEYLHSMTHQHGGGGNVPYLYDAGYRHFPISNYYPSRPYYPAPLKYTQKYPDAIFAPNAEQHSCTDLPFHWNAVGSYYATGGREPMRIDKHKLQTSPIEHIFTNMTVFDPENQPWNGIYRSDIRFSGVDGSEPEIKLTIEGALEVQRSDDWPLIKNGQIIERHFKTREALYLRVMDENVKVKIEFDSSQTRLDLLHLVQGVHRPWRDAVQAALDGDLKDETGRPIEGLQYPDAGGITINHPGLSVSNCVMLLDFDPRVLGIEFWNHKRYFGAHKANNLGFYELWDEVLRTGRRCFGFSVNDHYYYGRGRNVLLVPPLAKLDMPERERLALRAYRLGHFFGMVTAVEPDNAPGETYPAPRKTNFRFANLTVRNDKDNQPRGLEVTLAGADTDKRPNAQIRFITERGTEHIENSMAGYFEFPRDSAGKISCTYVRAEALAYPDTHNQGKPLTAEIITQLNVYQLSCINDESDWSQADKSPRGTVEMIFSQPLMFKEK